MPDSQTEIFSFVRQHEAALSLWVIESFLDTVAFCRVEGEQLRKKIQSQRGGSGK